MKRMIMCLMLLTSAITCAMDERKQNLMQLIQADEAYLGVLYDQYMQMNAVRQVTFKHEQIDPVQRKLDGERRELIRLYESTWYQHPEMTRIRLSPVPGLVTRSNIFELTGFIETSNVSGFASLAYLAAIDSMIYANQDINPLVVYLLGLNNFAYIEDTYVFQGLIAGGWVRARSVVPASPEQLVQLSQQLTDQKQVEIYPQPYVLSLSGSNLVVITSGITDVRYLQVASPSPFMVKLLPQDPIKDVLTKIQDIVYYLQKSPVVNFVLDIGGQHFASLCVVKYKIATGTQHRMYYVNFQGQMLAENAQAKFLIHFVDYLIRLAETSRSVAAPKTPELLGGIPMASLITSPAGAPAVSAEPDIVDRAFDYAETLWEGRGADIDKRRAARDAIMALMALKSLPEAERVKVNVQERAARILAQLEAAVGSEYQSVKEDVFGPSRADLEVAENNVTELIQYVREHRTVLAAIDDATPYIEYTYKLKQLSLANQMHKANQEKAAQVLQKLKKLISDQQVRKKIVHEMKKQAKKRPSANNVKEAIAYLSSHRTELEATGEKKTLRWIEIVDDMAAMSSAERRSAKNQERAAIAMRHWKKTLRRQAR